MLMNQPAEIIIKPSVLRRIISFLFGLVCVWFAFALHFIPQLAQDISQHGKWALLLFSILSGALGLAAFIVAFMPYTVKITPQYIQGPINIRPVLWTEVERLQYTQIRSTVILVFYLKKGVLTPLKILHLFRADKASFSFSLSGYAAADQKKLLGAIKKYTNLL